MYDVIVLLTMSSMWSLEVASDESIGSKKYTLTTPANSFTHAPYIHTT